MTHEIEAQHATEVVEQLEEEQIDLQVVLWFAGEGRYSNKQKQWFSQLRRERGEGFYSDLIFALLGRRHSQPEAHRIWNELMLHRDDLMHALGRNPGVVVAALDWLTNLQPGKTVEFRLVESDMLERMMERAVVDGLTGLYDHDTLLALFHKEIERARRHSERVSLLLLDLDDFKQVNDHLGHQKGDEALARLADIIRETIRAMDFAGRYGGEEFAVILPETDISAATMSAERLRKAVEVRFRQDLELTISVGVVCFPQDGDQVSTLVKSADEALYAAKAQGKNRIVVSRK